MQQAIVFAASAGLGYMFLRKEYASQLGDNSSHMGLQSFAQMHPTLNTPSYTPSPSQINLNHPSAWNPTWAKAQRDMASQLRLEMRHPLMNSYVITGNPPVTISDTSLPPMVADGNPYFH